MQTRTDLYTTIHKALRARLFDLGAELDRCDFSRPTDVTIALAAYRRTMGFIHEHHAHEDTFIAPALASLPPAILAEVTAQHALAEKLLAELDALVTESDGTRLVSRYHAFLVEYLRHMAYEETAVNAALWARYSDGELAGLRGRLQASIPPPRFGEWLEIILPAINLGERAEMLGGIKANAPAPAFAAALAIASRVLGAAGVEALRLS